MFSIVMETTSTFILHRILTPIVQSFIFCLYFSKIHFTINDCTAVPKNFLGTAVQSKNKK